MKKVLFVLLIAILTMVAFVSCKEELKPKTVVGSWEASIDEMTMTIDMKSDGTLAGTARGEEQDGDVTVTITADIAGAYAVSSNMTGTFSFDTFTVTSTGSDGTTHSEDMSGQSGTYQFDGENRLTLTIDGTSQVFYRIK